MENQCGGCGCSQSTGASGACAGNVPCARPRARNFSFFKLARGANIGLPGAIFQLSDPWGVSLRQAASSQTGEVRFGDWMPGPYLLQETVPPPGYQWDPTVHEVIIRRDGSILLDSSAQTPAILYNDPTSGGATAVFAGP